MIKAMILGLVGLLTLSCNPVTQTEAAREYTIHLNQVGYLPDAYKSAIVLGTSESFVIMDCAKKEVVHKGILSESSHWEASGEDVQIADFSSFTTPGSYRLKVGEYISPKFNIEKDVYSAAGTAGVKAYYFHRAGLGLEEKYAGVFAREAGHPDDVVYVHASAASKSRPETVRVSTGCNPPLP